VSAFLSPVVLQSQRVRLEPLSMAHADGLRRAAADGELWRLWYTRVPAPEAVPDYIARFLDRQQRGEAQAFAVCESESGRVVGHTSFCNADGAHHGVLRQHQLMPDGTRRGTVVFSILDAEWPAVKCHLQFLLESHT
jgi:hypothetical protein